MASEINRRLTRLLLAGGLAFVAAAAQVASGISVTQSQTIKVGMTTTEVQQILGTPARTHQYRNAAGPTWTYAVAGAPFGNTEFNVDYGADGKVASVGEFIRGSSH